MDRHKYEAARASWRRVLVIGTLAFLFAVAAWAAYSYMSLANAPSPAQLAAAAETSKARDAFAYLSLEAKAAFIMDISSGARLYAHNADAQLPLASLTKVPLALAVSEVLEPEMLVQIPRDVPSTSTTGPLAAGSRYRAIDLTGWMLVGSSNEGAEILANAADEALRAKYPHLPRGGAALARMNEFVRELGLTSIYFTNTSGLDESETLSGAYGSASDVAKLFAYAASESLPRLSATAQHEFAIEGPDGETAFAKNTDEALDAIPSLIFGKTGFTDLAGGNLAIVFSEDGRRLVAVVLGSSIEGRFEDMRQIVAAAESAYAK